jgi:thiol-disulfide isomerase/thioredoxin
LIDKAVDYVFYLTVSNDPHTQNELYKVAVTDVLQRMDDEKLRADFIQSFIQSFAKSENIVLTDYLFETFYNKISMPFQDKKFKTAMEQELKTAVGRAASDIAWQEAGKTLKLSEMEGYDYYVLMFWSTTCPHCMKEIPKLYDYTKDKNNIKVIAIGMETDESKTAWKSETYYYPTFSHILGIDKWDNPIAKAYNVFASPNYFILNADKIIIYKPYEMVDLEAFFDALENK